MGQKSRRVRAVIGGMLACVLCAACGSSGGRSDAPASIVPATSAPTTTVPIELPVPEPVPPQGTPDPNVRLGRVLIPSIDVNTPLFQGITDETFTRGAGWWPGTAAPGQLGNVVVGGHRATSPKPFRYLDKLEVGDEIVFEVEGGRFVYIVTKVQIVDNSAMWIVDQTREYRATLFACHPVGSTAQRIAVFATLKGQNAQV